MAKNVICGIAEEQNSNYDFYILFGIFCLLCFNYSLCKIDVFNQIDVVNKYNTYPQRDNKNVTVIK